MADALNDRMLEMMRRLKNLRDHESTNVNEAAQAAAKLQNLLLEYNLEEALLEQLGNQRAIYGQQKFDVSNGGPVNLCAWKFTLMHVIAIHNMCRSIHLIDVHTQASSRVSVIGERHNIAIVKGLYDYLVNELVRLGEVDWRQYRIEYPKARKRHFLHWFYKGGIAVINIRLHKQRATDKRVYVQQWSLVVIKEGQVQEAYDRLYPDSKKGSKSRPATEDMAWAGFLGRKAAEGINLDRQIEPAPLQEMAIGGGR